MAKKGNAWNIPQNRCTAVYFVAWSCTMLSLIFTIAKYNCTKISVAELSQRVRNRKGQKWSFKWQLYCQHRFLWKFPSFLLESIDCWKVDTKSTIFLEPIQILPTFISFHIIRYQKNGKTQKWLDGVFEPCFRFCRFSAIFLRQNPSEIWFL